MASLDSSTEWCVSLLPVPATTVLPGIASLTVLTSSIFSASVRLGDSPVVPETTTPSEPSATSIAASSPGLVVDRPISLEGRDHRGQQPSYVFAHVLTAPSAPS